jgi:hypothetical protein
LNEFQAFTGSLITLAELQLLFGTGRRDSGIVNIEALKKLVITKLVQGKSTSVGGSQLSEEMIKSMMIIPELTALKDAAFENIKNGFRCAAIAPTEKMKLGPIRVCFCSVA